MTAESVKPERIYYLSIISYCLATKPLNVTQFKLKPHPPQFYRGMCESVLLQNAVTCEDVFSLYFTGETSLIFDRGVELDKDQHVLNYQN